MKKFLQIILAVVLVFMPVMTALAATGDGISTQPVATEPDMTVAEEVYIAPLKNPSDLQVLVASDAQYSSSYTFLPKQGNYSPIYKIELKEKGWLFIEVCGNTDGTKLTLYNNLSRTSKIDSLTFYSNDPKILSLYLDKGTYYYQNSRWMFENYEVSPITYVGFMPATERIKIKKISYSADKSMATVKFDINDDYFSFDSNGTLRVKKGYTSFKDLDDPGVWDAYRKDNVFNRDYVYVTNNGTFSARVANGDIDKYFCDLSFDIKGIVKNVYAPKLLTYAKGTTKITGRATYGNTVYVTVNNKSYNVYVSKDKTWSITVPSLKIGTTIKAYSKNAAGAASNIISVKVK